VSPAIDLNLVLAGDRVAMSRAISIIENDSPGARVLLDGLFPKTGRAYRVGITGPRVRARVRSRAGWPGIIVRRGGR
jgi:hypothetical protein